MFRGSAMVSMNTNLRIQRLGDHFAGLWRPCTPFFARENYILKRGEPSRYGESVCPKTLCLHCAKMRV